MLIEHLLDVGEEEALRRLAEGDANAFYQEARQKFDTDPAFEERARRRVAAAAGRRPGDHAAVARVHRAQSSATSTRLRASSASRSPTSTSPARASTTRCSPTSATSWSAPASRGSATGALCVFPPGLHRPGRPAAPADHPQERRRVRLRHHRPGGDPLPGARAQGRPHPLRGRRHPGAALPDGVRRRAHGRLAARRRRAPSTCRSATCSARTARSSGPARGKSIKLSELLDEAVERADAVIADREPTTPETRAQIVARGRHRRGQVRRPVGEPRQRVRLRLRPHARARPATPARTCSTPPPGSARSSARAALDAGRRPPGRSGSASRPSARSRSPARLRLGRGAVAEACRAAPAVRLPVRPRPGVHRLLRELPGAQGRGRGGRGGRGSRSPRSPCACCCKGSTCSVSRCRSACDGRLGGP